MPLGSKRLNSNTQFSEIYLHGYIVCLFAFHTTLHLLGKRNRFSSKQACFSEYSRGDSVFYSSIFTHRKIMMTGLSVYNIQSHELFLSRVLFFHYTLEFFIQARTVELPEELWESLSLHSISIWTERPFSV